MAYDCRLEQVNRFKTSEKTVKTVNSALNVAQVVLLVSQTAFNIWQLIYLEQKVFNQDEK
jgi:hypothetical protein